MTRQVYQSAQEKQLAFLELISIYIAFSNCLNYYGELREGLS
jgi:hypothetical protein